MSYRRIASLKTASQFRAHAESLGLEIPFDDTLDVSPTGPLKASFEHRGRNLPNRFCILPMEGWDGTTDGRPSDLTRRRWRNFGASGASLIWGGEAVAVRADGRANPNQLWIADHTLSDIEGLRRELLNEHRSRFGAEPLVGLQLTHSGRYAKPYDHHRPEPMIAYHHPILDNRLKLVPDFPTLTDDQIRALVDDFILAATRAHKAGFDFVDVKHCHGYLGHELLSAVDRPGRYGGPLENRSRFLREVIEGIRAEAPGLDIGVRLSVFDWVPFSPGAEGIGQPDRNSADPYPYAFGGDGTGLGTDLREVLALIDLLDAQGVRLLCVTAGSPYYVPHIQRPALFPPSDGYLPPEDPLVGVARQIAVSGEIKRARPQMIVVGSAYSYLQDWLPNVAQAVLRTGWTDFVGLGRMVLSYPELPADVLAGKPLARKRICRTFSDCTTGPRQGLVSGCYPLDPFYKEMPEAKLLAKSKGK